MSQLPSLSDVVVSATTLDDKDEGKFDSLAISYILDFVPRTTAISTLDTFLENVRAYLECIDRSFSKDEILHEIRTNSALGPVKARIALFRTSQSPPVPPPTKTNGTVPLSSSSSSSSSSSLKDAHKRDNGVVHHRPVQKTISVETPSTSTTTTTTTTSVVKIHPPLPRTIDQSLAHNVPFDPNYCRQCGVYQKLLLLVQLAIVDQLIDNIYNRVAMLEVCAKTAPTVLWEHACAFFNTTSRERNGYAAQLKQHPQRPRTRVLEVTWGPHGAESERLAKDAPIRMPLPIDGCRAKPVFARLLVLMQIKVADTIITNYELHSTEVGVDTDVSQYENWCRVRDLLNATNGYRAEIRTIRNDKGVEQTELSVNWN